MNTRSLERAEPTEAHPPRRRFVLPEILAMLEAGILDPSEKVELIDGELIRVSPQGVPHFVAKSRLARHFTETVGPGYEVYVEPTLDFGLDGVNPEPEIAIVPSGRPWATLRPTDFLLVVEVSRSSLRYDLTRKAGIYAEFGIPEYWAFDVETRRMYIHRDPVSGVYPKPHVAPPSDTISPRALPQCALRMDTWLPFE